MASTKSVVREFEDTSVAGAAAVREYLTYRGANKEYFNRARVGAASMGAYARLRATVANERALAIAAARIGPAALALMASDESDDVHP